MRENLRHQLWIVLAAAVVLLTNLGSAALWDEDEPLYAACAHEMAQRGDWVVPTFNGELFPEKPPLMYWMMMGCFRLFGETEFAARFSSAVLGIGTALLTYHLGRLLFRAEVGFWAGLIVVTSIIFTVSGRAATTDSALVFFTTAAMLCFVFGGPVRWKSADTAVDDAEPAEVALRELAPRSWWPMALFYVCLALAVLTKGPIGLLLPLAMIGLFSLLANRPRTADREDATARPASWKQWLLTLLRVTWQLRPLTAIAVVGLITLPWYILVGMRTDGEFLLKFLGEQNFGRAISAMQGHSGPFFYYIPAIAIGFFPWSVFLAPTLIESVGRIRRRHATSTATAFVLCWLVVFVVFWSIPSTKLPHYVLTAYPALALLTAVFADTWITEPARIGRRWIRSAMVTYIVVGVAIIVALPIVTYFFLPGEWMLGLVGVVLVVGGVLSLVFAERGLPGRAMGTCAVTAVVFLTAMFGFAALRVDRYQNAPALTAEIRQVSPGPPQLAAYCFFRESLVFYARQPVARYEDTDQLAEFLIDTENPYVVTTDEHEQELRERFGNDLSVLIRQPRFLHSGELVVLGRRSDGEAPRMATELRKDRTR